MPLNNYHVENDKFEAEDNCPDSVFPCSACRYRFKKTNESPCCYCGHLSSIHLRDYPAELAEIQELLDLYRNKFREIITATDDLPTPPDITVGENIILRKIEYAAAKLKRPDDDFDIYSKEW